MTRLFYCVAAFAFATLAPFARAQTAINSSAPGIQALNFGVGCGSAVPYPTNTDDSTPEPVFAYVITNPLAQFVSVHFVDFNLPKNDYVVLRAANANDPETTVVTYHGDEESGDFYSIALQTTSIIVEFYTERTDPSVGAQPVNTFLCMGFTVDSYRFLAQPALNGKSGQEEVCGADESQEAACYTSYTDAYQASKAVARLLIHKSTGSFFCTGWLIGSEGHVITNNHCISTQAHASKTEFEFMAEGATCATNCDKAFGCGGKKRASSATLIHADPALDYALVKLSINLSGEYGYLQLRDDGAKLSERIYIPQHPAGWGKHIAMKTDSGWGMVTSLTTSGCATNQVAYMLDTQGGSSGSPVIAWSDNAVVALHHCGGCPNTAINSYKLIDSMQSLNILPENAIYKAPTQMPSTSPPTAAPTTAPTNAPAKKTTINGTIKSTATVTSVDYVDFKILSDANVELDILSMEAVTSGGSTRYVDVNGDCNAGYLDSSIALFSVDTRTGAMTGIAVNDNSSTGVGSADGSISKADSYLNVPLKAGTYRLAVSASGLTTAQAVKKQMPLSAKVLVCDKGISSYGNYRLTISSSATVTAVPPESYIGSQCNAANPNAPYNKCPYHREAALTTATGVEGTIVRSQNAVSVDYIPFTVPSFTRFTMELASYGSDDITGYKDVNGFCESAYLDGVVYLFRGKSSTLTAANLINSGDDDNNFVKRTHYHSISFRDPYLSLALPAGDYTLVVGRYPLSLEDAIARKSSTAVATLTPQSCGKASGRGHYLAILSASNKLAITSPRSFSGSRCPNNVDQPQHPTHIMGKSTDHHIAAKQEFLSLEQSLNQTADDASTCLKLLKKELSEYDSRHGHHFTNTAKSYLRSDMRAAKDTASNMKHVARKINKAHKPSRSEVESARNVMDATAKAMDILKTTARNYDKKNGKSTGVKGTIEHVVGENNNAKENKKGLFGTSDKNKDENRGGLLGMGNKDKYGHGNHGGGILGSSDTVESLVKSTLRDNFSLSPLSHQITVAGKSLSSSSSIVEKAKEAIHDVKDKLKTSPTHEGHHAKHPVYP
ncbi:hypothetical protein JM18_000122 [Phytophthora kernoviae]|uniref:Serine protease n=1 Tax=Phytophthora kernoviae TaxID=325452 RepID=A0A922AT21_9STRA|nr:hypothetical protein JM18_000122 [Phytophthora kernoviae]